MLHAGPIGLGQKFATHAIPVVFAQEPLAGQAPGALDAVEVVENGVARPERAHREIVAQPAQGALERLIFAVEPAFPGLAIGLNVLSSLI